MKKQICILGSTGSIGTQALDVISQHEDLYEVYCLTANTRIELLAEQAHRFHPAAIVVADETKYQDLCRLMDDMPEVKVYAGAQALCDIVEAEPIDMVLTAMVGFSGLEPTIHAIKAKKKNMSCQQGNLGRGRRTDMQVGCRKPCANIACRLRA